MSLARASVVQGAVGRAGWIVCAILTFALVALLGATASGGPLEPQAPPGSTMKPVEDLAPSWHQTLPASGADACNTERFTCVMGGTAVFDRETGLVWERTPGTTNATWGNAMNTCPQRFAGNRFGWRMPTVVELLTLIDSTQGSPALPAGNPFDLGTAPAASFWTATTSPVSSTAAWYLSMADGAVSTEEKGFGKRFWCVRGADPGTH